MLLKTHLAISIFAIILFLPFISGWGKILFIIVTLFATIIPDLDSRFSTFGRKNPLTYILSFFTNHRGILHSLTLCIILSIILAIFTPILAFGFFLGYSLHLLADSFTKKGVRPFWPSKKSISGFITTGSGIEKGIFVVFVLVDIVFGFLYLLSFFK